ncbi:hypothetical protein IMZ48_42930 [Candidatus Bathyarchaeota archaeon]|nr:hypothetical protein [Candidatus Bathyarchaeota archaeon]
MAAHSEYVLKRDGTNVVTDNACKSTSGTWASPYDTGVWTDPQDVDIDHMVPLSNAWKVSAHPSYLSSPHPPPRSPRQPFSFLLIQSR